MKQELIVIKTYFSRYEAEIARGLLESSNIQAFISGDDCGGMRPDIPLGMGNYRLLVNREKFEAARGILNLVVLEEKPQISDRRTKIFSLAIFLLIGILLIMYISGQKFRGVFQNSSPEFCQMLQDGFEVCKEFYKNGEVYSEHFYLNNISHGQSKIFYPNGAVLWEANYIDGRLEGKVLEYYPSGQIHWVLNYHNDKLEGKIVEYYETGEVMREEFYSNDSQENTATVFYRNGKQADISRFKLGKLLDSAGKLFNGAQKLYYENGNLWCLENYVRGELNGVQKEFYENGNLKFEKEFRNNQMHGLSKKYDANGQVWEEIVYSNGGIKKIQLFDRNGNLIFLNRY